MERDEDVHLLTKFMRCTLSMSQKIQSSLEYHMISRQCGPRRALRRGHPTQYHLPFGSLCDCVVGLQSYNEIRM